MVDLQYLAKLLPLLKTHGVASYKVAGLELLLTVEHQKDKDVVQDLPLVEESQLPIDLRTDGAAGYENLLFHSASPANEQPLPGLGEEPL